MSQENVEIVQSFWDAWERKDFESLFALYDQAIVWVQHGGPIEMRGAHLGHDGIRRMWRQWLESFETFDVEVETFIDAGDSVIAGWRMSGRGKASAAPADLAGWSVHTVRNGRLIRVDVFDSKAQALEAVGLSE